MSIHGKCRDCERDASCYCPKINAWVCTDHFVPHEDALLGLALTKIELQNVALKEQVEVNRNLNAAVEKMHESVKLFRGVFAAFRAAATEAAHIMKQASEEMSMLLKILDDAAEKAESAEEVKDDDKN